MQNIEKIHRVSRWMVLGCNLALVLMPLLIAFLWLDFERFAGWITTARGLPLQPEFIGPLNLALGFFCSLLPVSAILYGVWRLRKLFRNYQRSELFSEANANHLLVFARMLFLSVLLTPLAGALLSVVLTMNNPPGSRVLSIQLGSDQFAMLFMAGLFLAVAWTMREAQRLAAENAEFV